MSNEIILPPSLPEDAAKSTIPPTPNIRQTGPAKLLQNSITGVHIEAFTCTSNEYPFYAFACGVVTRACKASINLTGTEVPGIYTKYVYPLADTWSACVETIAKYFYHIYMALIEGETSLPFHPRNIGFALMAMARNRVASVQGEIQLFILTDLSASAVLTEENKQMVATLFRHQALSYDLVNVPVFESGPFPSSKDDQAKSPVEEYKLSLDQIGSTYTTFVRDPAVGTTYYDYYAEDIDVSTWWIKAALATSSDPPANSTVTATWSNISTPGFMLASWIAYADTVCDIPYVFFSQPYVSATAQSPTITPPTSVAFFEIILKTWIDMYVDNNDKLTGPLFADTIATSHVMFKVWNFGAVLYSPFGQICDELYIRSSVTSPVGSTSFERLLFSSTWRDPVYLPSIYTECVSSVAEQTIIKTTQEGFTHSVQIFNVPQWPSYVTSSTTQYVSIGELAVALRTWDYILNYRKFIKLNLNPEYKVNKAVMPYFFLHVPLKKWITLSTGDVLEPFDAIVTPYSARYIEDHNLHVLSRAMPWPRVYEISQSLLPWMPIIDVKPLSADQGTWDLLLPAFDIYQFSLLCVDMSYMADGCEMDAYLNKLRTSHLGFFAALAGLIPTAIKVGSALFKTIAKPKDIDAPVSKQNSNIDREQTNNMAMAGVSSVSQTINGEPGAGGTVDLSETVNVDPISRILESGKRYAKSKKMTQAVSFAGKALRFGRSFYNNYKQQN